MKKFILMSFIAAVIFTYSSMAMAASKAPPQPPAPSANVLTGCYQKVNGQLRIVTSASQCRPSEIAISWNITGPQGPGGPQGPAGPQGPVGPEGPQGPDGVVLTGTINGGIGTISANSTTWVFAGTTATISTTDTQRITGSAQAPLGTSNGGSASFGYDLCYRAAGSPDALTNFTGSVYSIGEVSASSGRLSFAAAASVIPGTGTWEVGYCILNSGASDLNNNSNVNGWIVVTNQ